MGRLTDRDIQIIKGVSYMMGLLLAEAYVAGHPRGHEVEDIIGPPFLRRMKAVVDSYMEALVNENNIAS